MFARTKASALHAEMTSPLLDRTPSLLSAVFVISSDSFHLEGRCRRQPLKGQS